MTQWDGSTVLVTGGAGFIGSQLVRRLQATDARVVVLDDLSSGHASALPDGVEVVVGDVADTEAVARAYARRPEVVFHLAALFANQNSVDHPERALEVNGLGTWRAFDAARRAGVRRVLYTSSSCVYGNADGPLHENAASNVAQTPYQATKTLGEQYAHMLHRSGVDTVITRLFNVYGPGDRPGRYRSVVPNFCAAALGDLPITLHDDGRATRDFTFVDDVVDGLLRCATAPAAAGRTFNLGSGRETTIAELAAMIVRITGSRSEVVSIRGRPWDSIQRRRADVRRAWRILGWRATCRLEHGLRATVAWLAAHLESADPPVLDS